MFPSTSSFSLAESKPIATLPSSPRRTIVSLSIAVKTAPELTAAVLPAVTEFVVPGVSLCRRKRISRLLRQSKKGSHKHGLSNHFCGRRSELIEQQQPRKRSLTTFSRSLILFNIEFGIDCLVLPSIRKQLSVRSTKRIVVHEFASSTAYGQEQPNVHRLTTLASYLGLRTASFC